MGKARLLLALSLVVVLLLVEVSRHDELDQPQRLDSFFSDRSCVRA